MRLARPPMLIMILRLAIIAAFLLLPGELAYAVPCATLKANPDPWVAARVKALVYTASRAYSQEKAVAAYERVLDGITATMRQCRLSEDEHFAARYSEFVDYVSTLSLARLPDHELGFVVPDKQYFAETRDFVQVPDFLLDQSFLRFVSRSETLNRAKTFLRDLNTNRKPGEQLIFFSYESRHLGTPDNDDSFRRLLIVVPGNAALGVPEKWVQFGVTDAGAGVRIRNVSVVSTLPAADGTSNVYFKDFYRTFRRSGPISISGRWELGYGDDNCVVCHKSGILPIFPVAGSVSAAELPALLAVNERFLTYGPPRFEKYLDERKLGPGLSSAGSEERKRRFGASLDGTVARAMACTSCHQPAKLGSLNWPMDPVLIGSYVNGGQMPFGYDLTGPQRAELYRKLIQEYFAVDETNPGILQSWLLGKKRQ